ncbi:primase C-terminal domain-containing protein [Clostridioides difficile]|nr:primase C-terminal domain-containing protein [Clostridioides difficile]
MKGKDIQEKLITYFKFIFPKLETDEKYRAYMLVENSKTNFTRTFKLNTYHELVEVVNKYNSKANIYISTCLYDNTKDKTKENILSKSVIVVDVDNADFDISEIYKLAKINQVFIHLVVRSGRGWHLYFKLDKEYSNVKQLEKASKHLCELFGGDKNSLDVGHVYRVPFTKNLKYDNTWSSIVNTINKTFPHTLDKLINHVPIKSSLSGNTELQVDNVEQLSCFKNLVKYGISKGFRNKAMIAISNTCKYIGLSEVEALQYAYEFNSNCEVPQRKTEVVKVVKSIYNNSSLIKPCKDNLNKKLCNSHCMGRLITVDDVLNKIDENIDNDIQVAFSNKLIGNIKTYINKDGKKEKGTMLSVLSGAEILIISELKTFRNEIYSVDDLIDTTNLSKPTIIKSLKRLEEFNIINSTKQHFNRSSKPTTIYFYNDECEQKYKEIHSIGRGLFIIRRNKLITDNDMKVYIALKYLINKRMSTTQNDIELIMG